MNASEFLQKYSDFPLASKLWVFKADNLIEDKQIEDIQKDIDAFTVQWQAHGAPLKAQGSILYNLFMVLVVDERFEAPSGCSIDSSVHFIKRVNEKYQLNFLDREKIAYLDASNNVQLADKGESSKLSDCMVFNTSVDSLASFKEDFVIPYKESAFVKLNTLSSFTQRL